jgi:DNA-binding transcriptional ArsR family regulator
LLGLAQPQVSKHLRVLREVGAVDARDDGRRRLEKRINLELLETRTFGSGVVYLRFRRIPRRGGPGQ